MFAGLGAAAGARLSALADLHHTLLQPAGALDVTVQVVALIEALIEEVPFVDDDAGRPAESVRSTAAEGRTSATVVERQLHALGLITGTVVAASPVIPLVLLYARLRLARRRELRALRRMLGGAADPALVEHLARVAVHRLPVRQLHNVSPCLELAREHHAPVAAIELRRLGVGSPGWLGPTAGM